MNLLNRNPSIVPKNLKLSRSIIPCRVQNLSLAARTVTTMFVIQLLMWTGISPLWAASTHQAQHAISLSSEISLHWKGISRPPIQLSDKSSFVFQGKTSQKNLFRVIVQKIQSQPIKRSKSVKHHWMQSTELLSKMGRAPAHSQCFGKTKSKVQCQRILKEMGHTVAERLFWKKNNDESVLITVSTNGNKKLAASILNQFQLKYHPSKKAKPARARKLKRRHLEKI